MTLQVSSACGRYQYEMQEVADTVKLLYKDYANATATWRSDKAATDKQVWSLKLLLHCNLCQADCMYFSLRQSSDMLYMPATRKWTCMLMIVQVAIRLQ